MESRIEKAIAIRTPGDWGLQSAVPLLTSFVTTMQLGSTDSAITPSIEERGCRVLPTLSVPGNGLQTAAPIDGVQFLSPIHEASSHIGVPLIIRLAAWTGNLCY